MNDMVQTCPAPGCGKTVHEQLHWVRCPFFKHQPICLKHCNTCKYHIDDEHCSYTIRKIQQMKEFKNKARSIKTGG